MITAAIVGTLAAIAIPNYQSFVARARQTEAKLALAGLYTALQTYRTENSTYTACLNATGFGRMTSGPVYYKVGIDDTAIGLDSCGLRDNLRCNGISYPSPTINPVNTCVAGEGVNRFAANRRASPLGPPVQDVSTGDNGFFPANVILFRGEVFVINAVGSIGSRGSSDAYLDKWVLDHRKELSHLQPGI